MFISDIYTLKASDPFEITVHEEATVNLELNKVSPCYNTLLTGKVLYENSPIQNATVKVFDNNFKPLFHTETDKNGIYIFKNILSPGIYKVIATAIGYTTSITKEIRITENLITKLSFTLKKSSTFIKGIVYGKILEAVSRKPIENATVYLAYLNDCNNTIYKTTSNSTGQYLIYNIVPNNYKLTVEKQGYLVSDPVQLTIKKYDRVMLNLDLIRDSNYNNSTISGTVTIDKKPISNITVFLYLLDKQGNEKVVQIQITNNNGIYIFSNLENGFYIVKGKLQDNLIFEKHVTLSE
ncbi:carboxypeptidase regulatory-like domain-containing protein [Clostridium sp. AWRP]|uniref:carboxypeptidase regulatory-like domain-containing protein n=1 Tax=Clostridium sp. AWRP TaxID=2212991 RepID=UPI000FDC02D3|nr:carboxypeptidase regulatory-like domain-containing protein [Clostridium sp. AWRP]AZV56615.1 hypothetical protein DMR38_08355 [Clostridium sp. AWRP]